MSRQAQVIGFPVPLIQRMARRQQFFQPLLIDSTGLPGVTVTAHATIHTMGSWSELIATTTADCDRIIVTCSGTSATTTDTRTLVDIGVGAVAAEVAIATFLPAGFIPAITALTGNCNEITIPVFIPKGTRIAARAQSLITVKTVSVALSTAKAGGMRMGTKVDTYGADAAASKGTNLPTSNTYVELTASTTEPYQALMMLPCGGTGTVYAAESSTYTLGIGATGAEVALSTTIAQSGSTETMKDVYPWSNMYTGNIPAGTRIACKQSIGRTYRDVIVLGIKY